MAALLGRNWLSELQLDWRSIFRCNNIETRLCENFSKVFEDGQGTILNYKGRISVAENATPRYFKPRPLPFLMKEKVENELIRLEKSGIISKVLSSEWAAPIVPVLKKNGSLRLCGDYRVTVNSTIIKDTHPIPTIEDIFAKLAGGTIFSKLDLSNAYLRIVLDDDSRKYTTINTHKGLFCYNRLPFGISSSPHIFQRFMDSILGDLDRVCCYLDDILVCGRTVEEHAFNLNRVIKRFLESGVRNFEGQVRIRTNQCHLLRSYNR